MSKKKIAVICGIIACAVFLILAGVYFFVIKSAENNDDFESLRKGMKPWEDTSVSGISVYVPEDYDRKEKEFYTSYTKGSAKVSLTSQEQLVENDLANFSYNAVRQYEEITDSFSVRDEYEEENSSTMVHVIEFDYSLNTGEEVRLFSCLSAYALGNGKAYVITCTADADDYSLYREDFLRIYKTMVVVNDTK